MRLVLADRQLALDLPHRAASTLDDFLPAPSNRAALDAVLAWPAWPSTALIVDGPVGSGKTHLARIWAGRASALLLAGAEIWDVANPLQRLGSARGCAIDDADRIGDERLLLHLYNLIAERGGHILLTAGRPLADWGVGLADLRSRLRTAWTVGIKAPDELLLASLLVKQLGDRQLRVEPGVVETLARHMERSFAATVAVVRQLDALSLRAQRPITVGLARAVLRELEERGNARAVETEAA
jgi:chromosomal replication initiation ATPase DnaA